MSQLNVIQHPNQQDPYCEFHFQNPNNPKCNPCKILIKKSNVCTFMYFMINGWTFKDDKREVLFQRGDSFTKLDTIVNGDILHYTLYDSEKTQIDDWIRTNLAS